MKKIFFLLVFLSSVILSIAMLLTHQDLLIEKTKLPEKNPISIIQNEDSWAEKQLENMTLEQKIAQLIMIRVYSNKDAKYDSTMEAEITEFQPGGICFFQGTPVRQVQLTNRLQSASNIPMLVAIDGEWGPAMRLDSCLAFPYQMTLGALDEDDDRLIYQMGVEVAKQCRALGIHINFAPCVDVNNNSENPVINFRSFGEIRENVAKKSIHYMNGMQDNGISACAKHFPGHGDTKTDSHHALPVINKTYEALDSLEFYPFKKIIKEGIDFVMISHLNIPALDTAANSIASLSEEIVTGILRKKMQFNGLVITDAMDMKGLRNTYPNGSDAEIKALLSGVDILLLPNQLSEVIPAIKTAVEKGIISEALIDEKCLKILKLKQAKGLNKFKKLSTNHLEDFLMNEKTADIIQQIEKKSLTLLKNENGILPLYAKDSNQTALLVLGDLSDSCLYQEIAFERHLTYIPVTLPLNKLQDSLLNSTLNQHQKIIAFVISKNQLSRKNYGISEESITLLNGLSKQHPIILGLYSNPYLLEKFGDLAAYRSIFIGYKPTPNAVRSGIAALYREIPFSGKLPVSSNQFLALSGETIEHRPQSIKMHPAPYSCLTEKTNESIEKMVEAAIEDRIIPGCQILALHNGATVYHRNFGKVKYDYAADEVDENTLYDLASLTKSLATAIAVMKLYDEGKIKLSDQIGTFLPYLKGSNKADLTLEELLTHTSGLPAFIPFYKELSKQGKWDIKYLRKERSDKFSICVAKGVYLNENYIKEIRTQLIECKLGPKKYVYSDLGYLFLKEMVEQITGIPFEQYLQEEFYRPLGLERTLFNPLSRIEREEIAPTEHDRLFRKQILQGYVHDQTSALYGGICGNAGLFSTASEVAVILQMLMNEGIYNGKTYLSPQTVKTFTSTFDLHDCRRRAAGFDTPSFESPSSILPEVAGNKTFGHQGFTGTVFWCDPQNNLVFIFLSNRVYPDVEPNNLAKSKLRLFVHEAIYEGLGY